MIILPMKKYGYFICAICVLYFAYSNLVQAMPSNNTSPVSGVGAPLPPNISYNNGSTFSIYYSQVGQSISAHSLGYSDPDNDPFDFYEYEWRTAPNGSGSLLSTATNYTPINPTPIYLRVRAISRTGYPIEYRNGGWSSELKIIVYPRATVITYNSVSYTKGVYFDSNTWLNAQAYCSSLNEVGKTDWALMSNSQMVNLHNNVSHSRLINEFGWGFSPILFLSGYVLSDTPGAFYGLSGAGIHTNIQPDKNSKFTLVCTRIES